MGFEALPAVWHLGGVSSPRTSGRPFLPVEGALDSVRTLLTRRSTDAAECSQRGFSTRRHHLLSTKASGDSETLGNGFSSRDPQSTENGTRGPSSSFLKSDASWSGQGFPETSYPSSRLLRWHSDGIGLKRVAAQFQNFPGDKWGRPDDELCELECFERSEASVAVDPCFHSDFHDVGTVAWLRSDPQGTTSSQEQECNGTQASAVDVTAPSFVIDRKFAERSEHPIGVVAERQDVRFVDQLPERATIKTRPPLERKSSRVCTSRGGVPLGHNGGRTEKLPTGLGERAACVSIPDSLWSLKKRNGRGGVGSGSSIKKALDSMVEMIRALQSYTLLIRNILVPDIDVQELLSLVHREMHDSFLWLFHQVFSCTPTLMVSVMILLANFTVHSLGDNIAFAAGVSPDPPTHQASVLQARVGRNSPLWAFDGRYNLDFVRINGSLKHGPPSSPAYEYVGGSNGGSGGVGGRSVIVAGGEDGDHNSRGTADRNTMFSEKDSNSAELLQLSSSSIGTFSSHSNTTTAAVFASDVIDSGRVNGDIGTSAVSVESPDEAQTRNVDDLLSYQALLERAARELELRPGEPYHHVELDPETLRALVAPVATKMESDNYPCFDRTDLEYQNAINSEPTNPMLLANYAQFLYVVRHNNSRAERFFRRALMADSKDGDILGRWASFLWLAIKDRRQAEVAYRKAIALDPSNPYHAGSYAHFLWHSGDD